MLLLLLLLLVADAAAWRPIEFSSANGVTTWGRGEGQLFPAQWARGHKADSAKIVHD